MTRPRRTLALAKVYGLLETGPVVLLTTARRGRANVMPMSWHTMLEFEPPLVGCVVSDRNHGFGALKSTRRWWPSVTSTSSAGWSIPGP